MSDNTATIETVVNRRATLVRGAVVLAALAMVSLVVMTGSRAAFTATTVNNGSSLAAGDVKLTDDDANTVMFNLSGMKPGDTATRCINVTYTGSLTADVKLYGAVAGSGLAPYLTTTIDIGSGAAGGAALSCTGFTGGTNLHNGTLAAFGSANTNYANGLGGFNGATNPTSKSYRVQVTLQNNNAAQGKNATLDLTWEAQNQ